MATAAARPGGGRQGAAPSIPGSWRCPHHSSAGLAPPTRRAGLLYTSAPRGELTGTAEFIDARSGLTAEVRFGKLEEARRLVVGGAGGRGRQGRAARL